MSEKLEIFDLKGKSLGIQARDAFYSEIKKEFSTKGKISKKIKSIRLLLINSEGRIYLQKRSKFKSESPGLYDKTIGGHVASGESWNMTVIRECAEELGFPATILTEGEFKGALTSTNLKIIGIFKKIDEVANFESTRIDKHGNKFVQPFIGAFFIGYYDGAIRFADGECSGIEVFSLDELLLEIKNNPTKFTEDIKYMIFKYKKYIKPIH